MSRELTDDERELWQRLGRLVRPLAKTRPKTEDATLRATLQPKEKSAAARPERRTPPATLPKSGPALAPLEQRSRRRLARGLIEVDDRIDLHGMRQERAFSLLQTFLRRAQAHGHRVVLVVTGKGRGGEEGRGVLRQMVPVWLARPDLRPLVVGFEPANRRHGGEGALYVRIRRRREARRATPSKL
jgi:DNA-nicking Smr family endonuclease